MAKGCITGSFRNKARDSTHDDHAIIIMVSNPLLMGTCPEATHLSINRRVRYRKNTPVSIAAGRTLLLQTLRKAGDVIPAQVRTKSRIPAVRAATAAGLGRSTVLYSCSACHTVLVGRLSAPHFSSCHIRSFASTSEAPS